MNAWKTVHDSREERPATIDTTTSAVVVYQRRGIHQETKEVQDGQTVTEWVYEQRELTRDEFVDLAAEELQTGDNRMTALEDAVCELDSIINA